MQETILIVILGVVALGAVAYPVLVGWERFSDAAELESEIRRYREALEAGTVCDRCKNANPADARFCAECGEPLADG